MDSEGRISHIKRSTFTSLGNCYCIFLNDSLFIVIGPHWVFNLCVIPIIVMILTGYLIYIVPKMKLYSSIAGTILIITCLLSYTITALKDPGIVLRDNLSDLEEDTTGSSTFCSKCLIIRDKSIDHCEECDLCMKNLDHHCIFTGKCIAKNNLLCFYLFLSSIFGFFIFSLFFVFTIEIKR
jgi:hypothetical protein